jgi:hypothetical protein
MPVGLILCRDFQQQTWFQNGQFGNHQLAFEQPAQIDTRLQHAQLGHIRIIAPFGIFDTHPFGAQPRRPG